MGYSIRISGDAPTFEIITVPKQVPVFLEHNYNVLILMPHFLLLADRNVRVVVVRNVNYAHGIVLVEQRGGLVMCFSARENQGSSLVPRGVPEVTQEEIRGGVRGVDEVGGVGGVDGSVDDSLFEEAVLPVVGCYGNDKQYAHVTGVDDGTVLA